MGLNFQDFDASNIWLQRWKKKRHHVSSCLCMSSNQKVPADFDASNGYTDDFEMYVGKGTPVSKNGLAYDVGMRLCKSLEQQGYHVYFDNFYTGVQLRHGN